MTSGRNLQAAVAWQLTAGYAQPLYLAAPPDCPVAVVQGLLLHARRQLSSPRPLALEYPADVHSEAIAAAGFKEQQTLIWMRKNRE